MPYVITTSMPETHEPTEDGQLGNYVRGRRSRVAVATLDEVRRDLRLLVSGFYTRQAPYVHGQDWSPWRVSNSPSDPDFADVFPESGGTIGPLPDGTIIEVTQVGWIDFEMMARRGDTGLPPIEVFDRDDYRADLIAAFNAS